METFILEALDYKLFIQEEEFKEYSKYCLHLVKHAEKENNNSNN